MRDDRSSIRMRRALAALALCASAPLSAQLPPTVDLSKEPLLGIRQAHVNVALALSVEFPTIGTAFNRVTYRAGVEATGYFDTSKCYDYDTTNEYFFPAANANADFSCDGTKFSGNFLNWATMSAIDVMRLAMTGGQRSTDTTSLTVLERAFLPNGNSGQPSNFYANASYFPRRWVSTGETGNGGNIATVAPGSVTPFGSESRISLVNCRAQVLFGNWNSSGTPTCDTPLRDARFSSDSSSTVRRYRVRVRVCDAAEGPVRTSLCASFPNGGAPIYKPVGQMQKNADNMRFSVFGYLMDQTTARYGAVLRSAMKYVGPNNYDAGFRLSGANAAREWDADTGIFIVNPDSAAEGNSGVANYLNKFGSVPGSEGIYKQFDPVSELYYESLRYLQGLAPTPAATSGTVTSTMKQGFPVITPWTDPLMCAKQPQYIITIADTNAWGDKTIPGNPSGSPYNSQNDTSRSVGTDEIDVRAWTTTVGRKALADGLLPVAGGTLTSSQANNLGTWVHSSRGNSFYMAGLAYWAKTQDIRTDVGGRPLSLGPQNVTTFTIDVNENSSLLPTERQLFLAGAYGSDDPVGSPNWMLASSAQRLVDAIDAAFARAPVTSGSLGGGTVTSGVFETGDTGVFVPQFTTSSWSGELMHFALSSDASGAISIAGSPTWRASAGIPVFDEVAGTTARRVFLGNRLGGGAAFTWSNLSSAQQTMLDTNPRTLLTDGNGVARVNYLLGSRIDEGIEPTEVTTDLPPDADGTAAGIAKPFRVRPHLLADIVNSAPVFIGKPAARISDSLVPASSYQAWASDPARSGRTRAVYVGTNGGMVHAFNAGSTPPPPALPSPGTGQEMFAYVPSAVVAHLNKLTHPGYVHQPMVDGPLVSNDAYALGGWRTVLSGSFGAGARGVFALDVTDPTTFSASNVLWEFTEADDADIGFVAGKPLIAPLMIRDGTGTVSAKWFVVTASGTNNYGADPGSDNANPYIFLLSLDKPAGAAWVRNSNYYKIQLPLDATSTAPNGLAQPGGVFDRLGALKRLYAGDLRGNMWRIDVSSDDPAAWGVGFSGTPAFVARDAGGNRQPITTPPAVAFGPGKGFVFAFGTGKLIARSDSLARAVPPSSTAFDPQTFYAVWDDLDTVVAGRSSLASRTATVSGSTVTVSGGSITFGNAVGQVRGWYVDLPGATAEGERVVSAPVLSLGNVVFNTILPGADSCLDGGSRSYVLKLLNGNGSAIQSTAGFLTTPLVVRTQLTPGSPDPTGFRTDSVKAAVFNLGTTGQQITYTCPTGSCTTPQAQSIPAGSWSWRELFNWRELRR